MAGQQGRWSPAPELAGQSADRFARPSGATAVGARAGGRTSNCDTSSAVLLASSCTAGGGCATARQSQRAREARFNARPSAFTLSASIFFGRKYATPPRARRGVLMEELGRHPALEHRVAEEIVERCDSDLGSVDAGKLQRASVASASVPSHLWLLGSVYHLLASSPVSALRRVSCARLRARRPRLQEAHGAHGAPRDFERSDALTRALGARIPVSLPGCSERSSGALGPAGRGGRDGGVPSLHPSFLPSLARSLPPSARTRFPVPHLAAEPGSLLLRL